MNAESWEEQDGCRTLVHDQAMLGCIPVTNRNTKRTGTVLEALCSESYRTVLPAYYESALKLKYARDDISSQMIDLLNSSMAADFIWEGVRGNPFCKKGFPAEILFV